MQTFLPYPSFSMSAMVLDRQRLGKQRVEAVQILNTLLGFSDAWENHPAVRMWAGYESALVSYGYAVCDEWRGRGYQDNMWSKFKEFSNIIRSATCTLPDWMGNKEFHLSHQSNLVRKWPEYYGLLFPGVPNNLPYVWPSKIVV